MYSDEKEERCGKLQKVVESLHLESNKLSQNLISITHFSRISCVCVYIYVIIYVDKYMRVCAYM